MNRSNETGPSLLISARSKRETLSDPMLVAIIVSQWLTGFASESTVTRSGRSTGRTWN
jgi:hypothetical protein